LGFNPDEVAHLIASLITSSDKKNSAQSPEAKRLASLLSDDFSDVNDRAGRLVHEIVRRSLERSASKVRTQFQDIIDVALARIDVKASLRYWWRQDDGSPIVLTTLNYFEIDFFRYAHEDALIPIVFASMGSGKFQPLNSKLLTPNGWTTMGEIKVGQYVIGSGGRPTVVVAIHPQGEQDVYRITFSDGSSTECGDEHLWRVSTLGQRYAANHPEESKKPARRRPRRHIYSGIGTVLSLADFKNKLKDSYGNRRYFIPLVETVDFLHEAPLKIDPYLLGLMLGDGSLTQHSTTFTNVDQDLIEALRAALPSDLCIDRITGAKYGWIIKKKTGRHGKRGSNSLLNAIKELGLQGHRAWEKFIPDVFKFATREVRLAVLQGLFDTDGNSTGSSAIEYTTTSQRLAEDVQFIVWSLAGTCKIKPRVTTYEYRGVKKKGRLSYRLRIKLPAPICPFRLKRKIAGHKVAHKYPVARSVERVDYVGRKICQCISVAAPDGLYVTDDMIVTHNSSLIRALICFEIGQNRNTMQQLICQSDKAAQERGLKIMKMLESPHYRKIFPHIKKDRTQWGSTGLLVQRELPPEDEAITRESQGSAGGAGPTCAFYGITSRAIGGTRMVMGDLDDIVTVESGLQFPAEGLTVEQALTAKVLTREKQPIGRTGTIYSRKDNETRFRIIGNAYSQDDPVFKRRDFPGTAAVLIGVNDSFTAFNVQVWGLPRKYFTLLKRKYGTGTVKFPPMPNEPTGNEVGLREYCEAEGIPVLREYTLGEGEAKDRIKPPDFTMEVPLNVPREYYIEKYRYAEDKKQDFDLPYRSEVYSDSDLLFPNFGNSVFSHYPDYPDRKMLVTKEAIMTKASQEAKPTQSGVMARLIDPPEDYKIKIAVVDLSKKQRRGTVITVAVLTPKNRRRIVEIRRGGWDGEQIAEQIGETFAYHTDLQVCYIESVALQSLFVDLLKASKEKYEWWQKIGYFADTNVSKNDPQMGIMVMGIGYAAGAFELPNVLTERGHGRKCECGYCVGIWDGTTQSRLAPVESDVLITWWGIHIRMPQSFKLPQTTAPTVQQRAVSGYDLMNARPSSAMAQAIMGEIMPGAMGQKREVESQKSEVKSDKNKEGAKDKKLERPETEVAILPKTTRTVESDWGIPGH
jgi:hypothetical protein